MDSLYVTRRSGLRYVDIDGTAPKKDLLGHKSGRITTHYSAAELENLITAANTVCEDSKQKSHKTPALVVLKGQEA